MREDKGKMHKRIQKQTIQLVKMLKNNTTLKEKNLVFY